LLSTIIAQVTGQLDQRFALNAFFPTLVFAMLAALVVVSGTSGIEPAIEWWEAEPGIVQALLLVGGVAVVFVAANLVANNILWITQLFEGYRVPKLFATSARRYQYARFESASDEDRRSRYPLMTPAENFAATRLGNLILNAETYPSQRYGANAVRMWPLLYHVVPEELLASMSGARASMELLLVVAFLSGLFAPLASVCLIVTGAALVWVLAALLGGAALATLAYAGALAPAAIFGDHIRVAFDLHRLRLLRTLRLPVPASNAEERRVWALAEAFLADGREHGLRYVGPVEE
jgi:uncharacterized membrane protein SirB2